MLLILSDYQAVLLCAKYAQGHVTESITTTSGSSAVKALPGWAVASGLAAAVVASTRGLALDLAPLRVNCVAPGLVATSMWDVRDVKFSYCS
jgi:NAD(P)-dependent dehydrogenase (short-subunit alcohol dehydrogenase family)